MKPQADGLTVEPRPPAAFVRQAGHVELCVILVNYNTEALLSRCLGCLRDACDGITTRVIVVDNASRDASVTLLKQRWPDCILVENRQNVGFGRANNQVLGLCDAEFVLLLNTDAFVGSDTLTTCLAHLRAHPRCGVLGVTLFDEAGATGRCARDFPGLWTDFALRTGLRRVREITRREAEAEFLACDWVTGCFYLVRQALLDEVGLFDPRYFLYFEEVDHCVAARRAGWQVHCLQTTSVVHIGGVSAATDGELTTSGRQLSHLQIESELLYYRKHNGALGALASVLLGVLAELIRAAKAVLKGRPLADGAASWRYARALIRIARQSSLGSRPSR